MKSNTSSKKKPFKLGSKARKALKAAQKSRASGGEWGIEEKQTKSFRYDEEKDEELKRLRALYASGAVGEKDEGNTECNNSLAARDRRKLAIFSRKFRGRIMRQSREVLSTEKEGEKDDALRRRRRRMRQRRRARAKTTTTTTVASPSEKKKMKKKKKMEKKRRKRQNQSEKENEDGREKKGSLTRKRRNIEAQETVEGEGGRGEEEEEE